MKSRLSFVNMLSIYGLLLIFAGGVHLLPLLVLPFYPEELMEGIYIAAPAAFAMLLGVLLSRLNKENSQITAKHGTVLVFLLWLSSALITAAPYMISGRLNFTQSFFEGMSGWTTTSMTVLKSEPLPHVLVLCRSITNFFGGVGLICVVLSTLSETYGMHLYTAEGHSDRLLPNLAKSARMIISLFAIYFTAGTVAYIIAGMPVFDAVNYCMSALSTGGMSINGMSITDYNSITIEIITMLLMILGATNFLVHMMLIKREFGLFAKIGEVRCFAFLIITGTLLITVSFAHTVCSGAGEAFRTAVFNTVSVLTTTGFSTLPAYSGLPHFSVVLLIFFMFVGGGAGSTAGGIKTGRLYLLCKALVWRIKRRFMSDLNAKELSINYPQGKIYLKDEQYISAYSYVVLHIAVLFAGVLVLTAHGYSLQDSLFEFTSVMGTVGVSSGIVSRATPGLVLWMMSIGMFLGRLEIIVVIIAVVQLVKDAGKAITHSTRHKA